MEFLVYNCSELPRISIRRYSNVDRVEKKVTYDCFLILDILLEGWMPFISSTFLYCLRFNILHSLGNRISSMLPIITIKKIPYNVHLTNANFKRAFPDLACI